MPHNRYQGKDEGLDVFHASHIGGCAHDRRELVDQGRSLLALAHAWAGVRGSTDADESPA